MNLTNLNAVYIHLDLIDYENIKSFVEEIKKNYDKIDILKTNSTFSHFINCFLKFIAFI